MGLPERKAGPQEALQLQTDTTPNKLNRYESEEEEISETEPGSQSASLSPVENDHASISAGEDGFHRYASMMLRKNAKNRSQPALRSMLRRSPHAVSVDPVKRCSMVTIVPKSSRYDDDNRDESDEITVLATPDTVPSSPVLLAQSIIVASGSSESEIISYYRSSYCDPLSFDDAVDMDGEVLEATQVMYQVPSTRPSLISIGQMEESALPPQDHIQPIVRHRSRKAKRNNGTMKNMIRRRLGKVHFRKRPTLSSSPAAHSPERYQSSSIVYSGKTPGSKQEEVLYVIPPLGLPSPASQQVEPPLKTQGVFSKHGRFQKKTCTWNEHKVPVDSDEKTAPVQEGNLAQQPSSNTPPHSPAPYVASPRSSSLFFSRQNPSSPERKSMSFIHHFTNITERPQSVRSMGSNGISTLLGVPVSNFSLENHPNHPMLDHHSPSEPGTEHSPQPANVNSSLSSPHADPIATTDYPAEQPRKSYDSSFITPSLSGSLDSETSTQGQENSGAGSPSAGKSKWSIAVLKAASSLSLDITAALEGSDPGCSKPSLKPKKNAHQSRITTWDESVTRVVGKGLMGLGLGRKKRAGTSFDLENMP